MKKLKNYLLLTYFLFIGLVAMAQSASELRVDNQISVFNRQTDVYGALSRLKPEEIIIEGTYCDDAWRKGELALFDDTGTDSIYLRYELRSHALEFKFEGENESARRIETTLIRYFGWEDAETGKFRRFINPRLFRMRKVKWDKPGFLEVIHEGEISLYAYHSAYEQQADYRPGITVGDNQSTWLKREGLWLYKDGEFFELPDRRKKLEKLFEEKGIDYSKCDLKAFDLKTNEGMSGLVGCLNKDK